jgi:hypothetical protein
MFILKNNEAMPAPYPKVRRELGSVKKEGIVEIDGFKLRKGKDIIFQSGFQEAIQTCEADVIFSGGSASAGKAVNINELVWCGGEEYIRIGDIKVGKQIAGVGGYQYVIGVYPQGKLQSYKVSFADGANCIVSGDHLWNYRNVIGFRYEWLVGTTDMLRNSLLLNPALPIYIPYTNEWDDRQIISIDEAGITECTCIAVTNSNSLFYIGKDKIITHNTFSLLMEAMRGLGRQKYSGLIVKKELVEVGTAGGILSDARMIYKDMHGCEYSSSDYSFKWDAWNSSIMLTHINLQGDAQEKEAQEKMKNKQAGYIAIDELTNFTFPIWKYWFSRNRDNSGMRPKMVCTMNANGWHWTSKMLRDAGYIGDDNFVKSDMIGVFRYFVINGETEDDIVWGATKDEVRSKLPGIEKGLTHEMKRDGLTVDNLIKSFTFIPGNIMDNRILTYSTQGGNVANLFNVGEAERMKLLYGYWGEMNEGEARVKRSQIEAMFSGENAISDDQEMYITADLSDGVSGSDAIKVYVWKGLSLKHIEVLYGVTADKLPDTIRSIANQWDVKIKNIAVDATGGGQYFDKYMKGVVGVVFNKVPIREFDENGNEILLEQYSKLRDQLYGKLCAYIVTGKIRIDIDPDKKFPYGRKKETLPLIDIIRTEATSCLVSNKSDSGKIFFIPKLKFKRAHGYSPDDLDAMAMRMIFELDASLKKNPEEVFSDEDYYGGLNEIFCSESYW